LKRIIQSIIIVILLYSSAWAKNCPELIEAASYNNIVKVKKLIEEGCDVDAYDDSGKTALMYAAKNGQSEIMNMLIKKGAMVDEDCYSGKTALMYAAAYGQTEIVKLLIENDVSIDFVDESGFSALMYAATYGQTEIVKLLIENDAYLYDKSNSFEDTALTLAAINNHAEIVKLLINEGAEVIGYKDIFKRLFQRNINYGRRDLFYSDVPRNARDYIRHDNGLHSGYLSLLRGVVIRGEAERACKAIKTLSSLRERKIKSGKTITLNDYGDGVALVTVLLKYCADPVDRYKLIPLLRSLIDGCVDINGKTDFGYTILMLSSQLGFCDVVKFLLEEGADVNVKNIFGKTALDIVKEQDSGSKCVEFLLKEAVAKDSGR
jgi:ankyrin repeat protein